ncbi:uncharacterized protein V1516DRAFT_623814 [Lipomyces oligophaga]|uniref:uncharacterized protein n=1 Tax=Lipomyces oligophaga TaxID=45792 RepID=UPI0034CE4A66
MPAARRIVPAGRALAIHHFLYAPLLNWTIISVFLLLLLRLGCVYGIVVEAAPLVTMSVANILLYGLSDTMAQTVTTMAENYASFRRSTSLGIEATEKGTGPGSNVSFAGGASSHVFFASHFPPANFKIDRLVRFATWGFLLSGFLYKWLQLLDLWLPITPDSVVIPVLLRVIFDQLVWTPIVLCGFFGFMAFVEGTGVPGFQRKLAALFVPTLKTNFTIWPAAQIINFRLIPFQYQLPFISTVGLLWNTWLSFCNAQEEA